MAAKLLKFKRDNYEEWYVNPNMITDVGITVVSEGHAVYKMCAVVLASGQRLYLLPDTLPTILEAMQEPSNDIDVPDSFFKAWNDQKGDDKDDKAKA